MDAISRKYSKQLMLHCKEVSRSLESLVRKRERLQDNVGFKTAGQSKRFSMCVLGSFRVLNPVENRP